MPQANTVCPVNPTSRARSNINFAMLLPPLRLPHAQRGDSARQASALVLDRCICRLESITHLWIHQWVLLNSTLTIDREQTNLPFSKNEYGRFHVIFSLRWTVGHRFRSNFGRAFFIRKQVSSQIFSPKNFFLAFLRLFYFSLPFYSNKNI